MAALFARTFGPGRADPTARPGSARWRDVLSNALDNVIDCPRGCGWTYYRLRSSCPNCGVATNPIALVTVYAGSAEQPPARDSLVVAASVDTAVLPRHLWGRYDQLDPVVTFRPIRGGFDLRTHDEARLTDGSGRPVAVVPTPGDRELYRVRLKVPGRPARILALRSVRPS
jgi:hypothetical protein